MGNKNAIFVRHEFGKKRNVGSKIGAVIFVITLILVNYWVFLKDNLTINSPAGEQTVQPPPTVEIPTGQTEESAIPIETPENVSSTTVAGELHSGETVLQALQTLGVKTEEALPLISAMEDVMDFRSARAGNSFRVEMDKVGKVVNFEYKQSSTEVYVVKRTDQGKLQASKKEVATETKVAAIGCTIQGSLFNSFKRCGGDGKLSNLFMNLFAWDFNFFEQAREGDTIRMLIEKVYVDGKFMRYGRILAAEYEGQVVGKYSVFHFKDPEGIEGYYTLDGQALRKEFLKVPVDYAALENSNSSKTAGYEPRRARVGDLSGYKYPAPPSAPVWSVASGTVTFAGQTKTDGLVVEVQHAGGYVSRYTQLGVIAKGVAQGAQVFQKSVIGAVKDKAGKDGPYLLFALRRAKHNVDHMRENFPGGEPIPGKYMELFEKAVARFLDELKTIDIMGLEDSQA